LVVTELTKDTTLGFIVFGFFDIWKLADEKRLARIAVIVETGTWQKRNKKVDHWKRTETKQQPADERIREGQL